MNTSGEPKARAKLANIPANKIKEIFEKKSAMQEEYKAMSNALLASLFGERIAVKNRAGGGWGSCINENCGY